MAEIEEENIGMDEDGGVIAPTWASAYSLFLYSLIHCNQEIEMKLWIVARYLDTHNRGGRISSRWSYLEIYGDFGKRKMWLWESEDQEVGVTEKNEIFFNPSPHQTCQCVDPSRTSL